MKIVDRAIFLSLPAETLFMKYTPCAFGPLAIKGDTVGNDYLVQHLDLVAANGFLDETETLFDAEETGSSFDLDFDCLGRDGEFDRQQLFAIFEPADLAALLGRLNRLSEK